MNNIYRIGGIDLSLTGTGVSFANIDLTMDKVGGPVLEEIHTDIIKSKKNGDTPTSEIIRMNNIIEDINIFFHNFDHFALIAIEGISYMSKNTTSISQLSGLSYMLRRLLLLNNIPFLIVSPSTLKKFTTGSGNAKKDMMLLETYKKYGMSFSDDNQCDAYCLMKLAKKYYTRNNQKLTKIEEDTFKLLEKQQVCL